MVLIDRTVLDKFQKSGAGPLLAFLHEAAHDVMRLKAGQLEAVGEEAT
jgi:hypothetical protein